MASSSRARSVDLIDADTERTALLAATPTQSPGYRTSKSISQAIPNNDDIDDGDNDAAASAAVNHLRALLRPRVVVLSIVLIFFIELGIGMGIPPTNAVMESIICRQMHPGILPPPANTTVPPVHLPGPNVPELPTSTSTSTTTTTNSTTTTVAAAQGGKTRRFAGGVILVDDPTCKHPDVQGYLAMLRGWQNTFECFPGLVGAVPYGILSDRWGRRPVLGLGLAGIGASVAFTYIIFYFSDVVPLWTTWFSAAFQLIGGGGSIVVAMLYTAVADVVPPAERTTVFFQMAAVFLASQMIAGPLGGTMLLWDPWIPLLVSLLVLVLTALSVLVYPETVHLHDGKGSREESHRVGDDIPPVTKLVHKVREGFVDMRAFVLGNASVVFLLLSFVFVVLGRYVGEILLQYSTDRYGWSWSTASMVLTIRNAGSLVTLLAAMPVASWFCTQHLGMESVAKDLWLTRWSGIFHVVGSFTIAAAANGIVYSFGLAWFALGSGMVATTRSLLNALVEEHHVGTLNSLIALMETVGLSVSGPLLAGSLRVGLDLGGAWIGLPFFTAGVFFVVSTAIVWFFRLPDSRSPSTTAEPSC
ncbi:major facilitator superfamily domain-containing protein [Thermothelomyces heterothallicus CBS 202.75]|uniref:major facilitator superfamily domain-containing protein n=1 Tax=Thermothelomyces heterothallicus CBS 202.75 TaxID=1149848 RepID=UPI003742D6D4